MVADAGVMGHQKADAALFHIATHHGGMGACQHLNNLPLGASPPIQSRHGDQHFVAVKDLIHLPSGEKQILTALKRPGKSIAVAMAHHAAVLQVHTLGHAKGTAST